MSLQANYTPPPTQQGVRTFVPQPGPVLKNAGQYQQPTTLGSQLYPVCIWHIFVRWMIIYTVDSLLYFCFLQGANIYQPAPPAQASQPVRPRFQPNVTAAPSATSFVPGSGSNISRPGVSPAQPSSPNQPAQVAAPPPPPTVQTVDTSNVSGNLELGPPLVYFYCSCCVLVVPEVC